MNQEKFYVLSAEEMLATQGGKFWGKETTCGTWKSIVGNYSQRKCTTKTYRAWIRTDTQTTIQDDGIDS